MATIRMKNLVVTAADEPYAPFLRDLLDSLQPHADALSISVACCDLGLSPATKDEISNRVSHLIAPEWPFRPHEKFAQERKNLSRAVRPFLPQLFAGYDTYIWIDADAWVQKSSGLQWLIQATRYADMAAIPTLHRSYALQPRDSEWLLKRYEMAFGAVTAQRLMGQPYINSGVFAAPAKSPLWQRFANRFQAALDRWEGDFLSDQAVLNGVTQLDSIRFEKLPAQVNWISHLCKPVWDPRAKQLVVPAMPFEPIMVLHNTFNKKSSVHTLPCMDGTTVETELTYSAIQRLAARD